MLEASNGDVTFYVKLQFIIESFQLGVPLNNDPAKLY